MDCTRIGRDDPRYPAPLELYLTENPPPAISAAGNLAILERSMLGLFCSSRCPGTAASLAYDLAQRLRDDGRTVISGFHAPMEKECLKVLLRSPYPVVLCPPRALETMRLPGEWKRPLAEGRLLALSAFEPAVRRATGKEGHQRNLVAAALADELLIAHAADGSKLWKLARETAAWGKPLYTLPGACNAPLLALGAKPFPL
ncbi:MAG: DNA-processing protein DprA [Kiritimatiellae bacterium]|nr:DNA-processing protein DprA [Kiritimatiellia bacterium]